MNEFDTFWTVYVQPDRSAGEKTGEYFTGWGRKPIARDRKGNPIFPPRFMPVEGDIRRRVKRFTCKTEAEKTRRKLSRLMANQVVSMEVFSIQLVGR